MSFFTRLSKRIYKKQLELSSTVKDWSPGITFQKDELIIDPATNLMYRVDNDFISDGTDIQNDINAGNLVPVGGTSTSSTGGGLVDEAYENRVVLSADSATVTIGISEYDKNSDLLFVYQNSTFINNPEDYTINSDGTSITNPNGNWLAGTVFDFIVFKTFNNVKVNNWSPSTSYEQNEIIIDSNTNYIYRAKVAFISDTTNIQNDIDVGRLELIGGSESSQVTKLNITATSTEPHMVDIPIPETNDFNRQAPDVLKFVSSQDNITKTICDFDQSDKSDFENNDYIDFNQGMYIKTTYLESYSNVEALGSGKKYTFPLDLIKYTNIQKVKGVV